MDRYDVQITSFEISHIGLPYVTFSVPPSLIFFAYSESEKAFNQESHLCHGAVSVMLFFKAH